MGMKDTIDLFPVVILSGKCIFYTYIVISFPELVLFFSLPLLFLVQSDLSQSLTTWADIE